MLLKNEDLVYRVASGIALHREKHLAGRITVVLLLWTLCVTARIWVRQMLGGYSAVMFSVSFGIELFVLAPVFSGVITTVGQAVKGSDCGFLCRFEYPSQYFSCIFSVILFWVYNFTVNGIFALIYSCLTVYGSKDGAVFAVASTVILTVWIAMAAVSIIKTLYYYIVAAGTYMYPASAFGTLLKRDKVPLARILRLFLRLVPRMASSVMIFTVPENIAVISSSVILHYKNEKHRGEISDASHFATGSVSRVLFRQPSFYAAGCPEANATFRNTSGRCTVPVGVASDRVYSTRQSPAGR